MKKLLPLLGVFLLSTFGYGQISPGANCGSAAALPVNATCTNNTFSVSGLSGDPSATCGAGGLKNDGYFSFTATATTTYVDWDYSKSMAVEVYSDCAGTVVTCDATGSFSFATVIGNTYYVRPIHDSGGGSGSGNVCVYTTAPPTCIDGIQNQGETGIDCGGPCAACPVSGSGDDCTDAVILTPGTQQCGTNSSATTGNGNFDDGGSAPTNPCNSSYNDGEYWFSYVGTGTPLQLDVSALTATYSGLFVFDACPNGTPACIASYSSGSSTSNFSVTTPVLTLGTTYYITIINWSTPYETDFCLDATVLCSPTFTLSNGTNNCPTGTQYYIDVDITSLGTAASVEITNDGGAPSITGINSTGVQSVGPFAANTTVNITVTNEADGSCTTTDVFTTPVTCPPVNDPCGSATALPCSTTNLAGTTVNTTNVADPSGCASNYGVWYSFAGDGQSTTISSVATFDHEMVISSGNCGSLTNITCEDGASSGGTETYTFTSAIATTYFVYIAHYSTGSSTTGTFTISRACFAPPTNDEPCAATAATVNADLLCGTVTAGYVTSATNTGIAACIGSGADDDVWFSFVATSTVHNFDLLNITGSTSDLVHEIFDGPCGSVSSIGCSDPESSQFSGFTIGNTYYVRVYTYTATGGQTSVFDLCIGTPPAPPSNNPCGSATALPCGTTNLAGTTVSTTNIAHGTGCSISNYGVWYTFVGDGQQTTISTNPGFDIELSISTGSCGSLTSVSCTDASPESATFTSTNGVTYYVYIAHYSSGSTTTGTFTISRACFPPPPNDEPCNATAVTVNADLLCGTVTSSYTNGATDSGVGACVGSGADDDVWFSFVATSTVHNFDLLNITGSSTDMVLEIFSGACGSISTIGCSDPESSQFSGFTIGTTYHIRVYTYYTGDNASFDLCIGTPPPPPSNDEPCGAITLSVNNGSCAYQTAVLGSSTSISAGMPAPGCGSLGPDVWFKVTVPAGGLIIDMASNGGPTDFDMAWYTGPNCNNLNSLVECDAFQSTNGSMPMICRTDASCTVPGDCDQNAKLSTGTTVYIRVWESGGGTTGPFDICAYEPAPAGGASNCGNATVIAGLPYSNSGATTCCRGNTYDATDGCNSSYQDGEDFLYEYTPAANEQVDITLTGTLSYTGIFITDKCPSSGGVNCIGSATSSTGNPTLCAVSLDAGTTYYIMVDTDPTPTCTPFNINIMSSTTPTCGLNYSISNIGYSPDLNNGTNIALPTDDRFSSSYVPIGFNFCFDGFEFSQCLVSSNGYIIFDAIGCSSNLPSANAAPGATSEWSIDAAVPNTNDAPRNSIMFPWQDVDPSLGGTIKYQTLGVSPNRRFVLTFDQIPYFSCTSLLFTGQLKLYETTNDIEIHIGNKEDCSSWNGGAGILGLHNFNGTVAVTEFNYPATNSFTNQARLIENNCVGPCIVLPVKLVEFKGTSYKNYNLIEWSTSTEINNDYFVLERSNDGQSFEDVDIIQGGGNSNVLLNYSYQHKFPHELEYYRLKQVDFDGQFEYSNIIAVRSKTELNVSIYPNPSKNNLFIGLSESTEGIYTVIYTSVLGSVNKEQINITKGTNTYQVNKFINLSPGIYFVQILDENNELIKTQKIVKE